MKYLFLSTVIFFLMGSPLFSQDSAFAEGMKEGFTAFDKGEKYEDWIRGAELLSTLGKKYPDEWLPEYWSSYFYTQIARGFSSVKNPPKDMSTKQLLKLSQQNLDVASAKIKHKSPEQESDFHALQSLIYSFQSGVAKSNEDKKKFKEMETLEIKQAIQKNPNNPLMEVIIATKLIYQRDYKSILAGRTLLLKAKQTFDCRFGPRYLSTHWNEEWLGYWLPLSEKGISKLSRG